MRILPHRVLAVALAAAALVLTTAVAASATPRHTGVAGSATKTVRYDGYEARVPATWPVHDLTKHPAACVRFDRHAVYLGHPGADQRCPAHLVGRTAALLLEPYDRVGRQHVSPDTADVQALSSDQRVLITVTYRTSSRSAHTLLAAGSRLSAEAPASVPAPSRTPSPVPHTSAVPRTGITPEMVTTRGTGFDTCATPSTADMSAWRTGGSPYRSVGIYIGGINRACDYGNLTSHWVRTVRGYGYTFMPTYVGLQAPCSGVGTTISEDPATATRQGTDDASGAVLDMRALGLGTGNPVYLDVEQYNGDAACSQAVLGYVSAWTRELHHYNYVSGYYSSNVIDVNANYASRTFTRPDAVWIARWNGVASVSDPVVPATHWEHRRLHQYVGGHLESYGRVSIDIDSDYLDGPVGAPGDQGGIGSVVGGSDNLGGALTSAPAAASQASHRLDVAVRGPGNLVYVKSFNGRGWSGFTPLPGPVSAAPTIVSSAPGRLDVFARGGAGDLVHAWSVDGSWSKWQHLGGRIVGGPGVASQGVRSLDVVVRGTNSLLYTDSFHNNRWTGFHNHGGILHSDPSVVSWRPGRLDVVAQGGSGNLVHRVWHNGTWSSWEHVNATLRGSPSVLSLAPGSIDVYAQNASHQLEYITWKGKWGSWLSYGGSLTSDPGATSWGSGRTDVFFRSTAGNLTHRWFFSQ